MENRTWPVVVATGLFAVALLLVVVAIGLGAASQLSAGQDDSVVVWVLLPLLGSAAALAGAVTLLARERRRGWGRFLALGALIALVLVLGLLFLPELFSDA